MIHRICSTIVVISLLAVSAFAHAEPLAPLAVKTDRVIIFKDGYCMFIKQATGTTDAAGKAVIEGIPDAMVLGTFWVVPKSGELSSMVARQRIVPRQGRNETQKSLLLEFAPQNADQDVELTLMYFGPGIRWIPAYRISLNDSGKADMVMQAEILNEAEDLGGVVADLVVGAPNFRFKDVVSPMSLEATLRNTLQQTAPQIMTQSMSNVLMSQRLGDAREFAAEPPMSPAPGVPTVPSELVGSESQDLFFYHIPKLSLLAGERAAIPVTRSEIPFKHIYTWDVALSRSGTEAAPSEGLRISPVKLLKNEIWHQIELSNETKVPWTTGAALVMEGYRPIAQELLTYTSIGATCELPLTVAVDIRGTYSEEETGRELKSIRFDGNDYVRVSKKGTLEVTNHKKESVPLNITCGLGGNATTASDGGEISIGDFSAEDWRDFRGSPALNGHSTVTWELTLNPGETKKITCEYYYYAR